MQSFYSFWSCSRAGQSVAAWPTNRNAELSGAGIVPKSSRDHIKTLHVHKLFCNKAAQETTLHKQQKMGNQQMLYQLLAVFLMEPIMEFMQHQLHWILPHRADNNIPQFRLQVTFGAKIFQNELFHFNNWPEITPIWIKYCNHRTIFCKLFGHYNFKCNQ